ncbi:hypothetical protein SLG_06060 [Sphingobium sp. SYK-6]|nr:hypothetical protein SLG_06060 [Sphingobium sp. SYK-6]
MGRGALAKTSAEAHGARMVSLLSVLIGAVALILAIPAIIPGLGWANWLIVPLALFGALVGQFASGNGARNFCLAVAAFGMLRLWAGGGLF